MGFISRRIIPRNVRRAANPVRTLKTAATPRPIKKARWQIRRVTNPIDTIGYELTKTGRKRRA